MKMEQVNSSSNTVWLWLSDEENWERFSSEDIAQIEHALAIDHQCVILERDDRTSFLDLSRLTQTNIRTGRQRPIYPIRLGLYWVVDSEEEDSDELETFFSKFETQQLEKAFFDGNECFILQRSIETYYVDFLKWTVANLSGGSVRNIKVTDVEGSSPCRGTSSNDPFIKPAFERDDTECTLTSVSSLGSDGLSFVHKHERRTCRPGTWRWEDDADTWSAFDDEIALAIEHSWESGAPELTIERGSSVYFIDLLHLTQVNVETGFTRAIQRVDF